MTITFNEIPARLERPGEYVEVSPFYGQLGVLPFPARALILAQMVSGGTGALLTPYTITRKQDATTYFGAGSQAEAMAWAFLDANQTVPLDVMAVADGGSATAATGIFVFPAAATAAAANGTVCIGIAGKRYAQGVAAGDLTSATITALTALINADPQAPVTASTASAGGHQNLTLTAKNLGVEGNNIDLVLNPAQGDVLPQGYTATITAMSGGATNPDITSAIAAINGVWYTDIAMPWQDTTNVGLLGAELTRRYNALVVRDAHAYVAFTGTYSQIISKIAAANNRFITAIASKNFVSLPWAYAASLMGVAADRLTADPAAPLRARILPNITGTRPTDRWTQTEQELLLENGGSTYIVDRNGQVSLQRVVTTYLTNAAGVADPAFHEIQEPKVATRIRYDWRTYFALTYPSNKLSDDGSLSAESDPMVVTPSRIAGSWAARMLVWAKAGWVENETAMARAAVFERDASNRNRVNCRTPYQRIGQMNVLAQSLMFEV